MQLAEWSERRLLEHLEKEEAIEGKSDETESFDAVRFVFFYTPFCGTCKVGERMIEIIAELHPDLNIVKCSVNLCRVLPFRWQIESVPCIVKLRQGILVEKRYRLDNVDELRRWLIDSLSRE